MWTVPVLLALLSAMTVCASGRDYRPGLLQAVQDFHQSRDADAHFLALLAQAPELLLGAGELARAFGGLARVVAGGRRRLLRRLQRLLEVLHARAQLGQLLLEPLGALADFRKLLLEALVPLPQLAHERRRLADLVLEQREAVHARPHSPRMSQPRARSAATIASTEDWTSSPVRVRAGSWKARATVRLTLPASTGGRSYLYTYWTSRSI